MTLDTTKTRKQLVSITIDYETWHPIPPGCNIDWQKDIIDNTEKLMDAAEKAGAVLTFMAEMGEYFWLEENNLEIACKIRTQLQKAILRKHDVQLHLHPNWMPETGPKCIDNQWSWNWSYASANDYPFDLTDLIKRCKNKLEEIIRPVNPEFEVTCFRAGAYRVQPFDRLSDALISNGIYCDTSVFKDGISTERGYDFSKCPHSNQPYFCSTKDPQYEYKNSQMIELPICTFPKKGRWSLDNDDVYTVGRRFLYAPSSMLSASVNFFVMLGHSKGNHDYGAFEQQLKLIGNCPGVEFVKLSEMHRISRENKCVFPVANLNLNEIKYVAHYLYSTLVPQNSQVGDDAEDIIATGQALCLGYTTAFIVLVRRLGYHVKPLSLYAKNMITGYGKQKKDSHEVAYLTLNGKKMIVDVMAETILPYNIFSLLRNPQKATQKINPDARYIERKYKYYDTDYLYNRVTSFRIRDYYISGRPGQGRRYQLKRYAFNLFRSIFPGIIPFPNIWRKGGLK